MFKSLRRVVVAAAVVGATLVGAGFAASPASADPYVVTLTASDYAPGPNQQVRLTMTVTPAPPFYFGLRIVELTSGEEVVWCQGTSSCSGTVSNFFGAYTYQAFGGSYASNPITVFWGVGSTTSAPAGSPSYFCDSGLEVFDGTVSGAYVKVKVLSTLTATSICYRVDAVGTGRGGRIAIEHGTPGTGIDTIGIPSLDNEVGKCTSEPGNQLTTPHPIADFGALGTDVFLDAYVNTSVGAWLCFDVANIGQRVVVPMSLPGVDVDPNISVNHYADPA